MTKILRIIIAIVIAIGLSAIKVNGNAVVLQTLFTVLGIVFSISMSLLVSFNLSKVLNKQIRKNIRFSIEKTRNMLLCDFGISTLALIVALLWNKEQLCYTFFNWCTIDIMLISVVIIAISLIYEIYNFRRLHKFHTDIEDAVIEEETNKVNRK